MRTGNAYLHARGHYPNGIGENNVATASQECHNEGCTHANVAIRCAAELLKVLLCGFPQLGVQVEVHACHVRYTQIISAHKAQGELHGSLTIARFLPALLSACRQYRNAL